MPRRYQADSRSRKQIAQIVLLVIFLLVALGYRLWLKSHTSHIGQLSDSDSRCGALASAWQHVYRPDRLEVVAPCLNATGTVMHVHSEPDGDLHVALALDAGQEQLLNQENSSRQHGWLVVEVICTHEVSHADAVNACTDWDNGFHPRHGQHVSVTGAYVLDHEHGWMELHPISSIEQIP